MLKLWTFLKLHWEKFVFFLDLCLFLLVLVWAVKCLAESPRQVRGRKTLPLVPRLFAWDVSASEYFQPEMPVTLEPNPFHAEFKLHHTPPPAPPEPPKPPEPVVAEPAPEPPPEPETPPKKPEPPPVLTLLYRGSYTNVKGDTFIKVVFGDSREQQERSLVCRIDEELPEGYKITAQNWDSLTVLAPDGRTIQVPWNKTVQLSPAPTEN